jgi:hypothetical protein
VQRKENSNSMQSNKLLLALTLYFLYNRECWFQAMMRKVADTPGPFAMVGGQENFRGVSLFSKWTKRRENNGKAKDTYSFESL